MSKRIRLDVYLAEHNSETSRERARKDILAGWVKVDGETIRTPSKMIQGNENVTVERPGGEYVSRGGQKLEKALNSFNINIQGKNVLDLGSSTGGFTDCLLKFGANKVYAVDVGYGQLDYKLRQDERVVVWERTNARKLSRDHFTDDIHLITADLSFVSIIKVIQHINTLFQNIEAVLLIKPQFEALPGEHKKGVVRNKSMHVQILNRVLNELIINNVVINNITFSPIRGPKGNIEFLCHCCINTNDKKSDFIIEHIAHIVDKAHDSFG